MISILAIGIVLFASITADAGTYKFVSEDGVVFFTNTPMGRNGEILTVKKSPLKYRSANNRTSSDRDFFQKIAEEKARYYNIDPQLVKAIIKVESNWNPDAVSPKGAIGLMQLMPSTASLMGVYNPFKPEDNIDGGIRYLKYLMGRFKGDLALALAAYNAGPKLVERVGTIPSIPETTAYVRRVLTYYYGSSTRSNNIQSGIKRELKGIRKVVQEDGTILFTNSSLMKSYNQ